MVAAVAAGWVVVQAVQAGRSELLCQQPHPQHRPAIGRRRRRSAGRLLLFCEATTPALLDVSPVRAHPAFASVERHPPLAPTEAGRRSRPPVPASLFFVVNKTVDEHCGGEGRQPRGWRCGTASIAKAAPLPLLRTSRRPSASSGGGISRRASEASVRGLPNVTSTARADAGSRRRLPVPSPRRQSAAAPRVPP